MLWKLLEICLESKNGQEKFYQKSISVNNQTLGTLNKNLCFAKTTLLSLGRSFLINKSIFIL